MLDIKICRECRKSAQRSDGGLMYLWTDQFSGAEWDDEENWEMQELFCTSLKDFIKTTGNPPENCIMRLEYVMMGEVDTNFVRIEAKDLIESKQIRWNRLNK